MGALLIRLLLLPLSHTWDAQTWINTFAGLAANANPLDAVRQPYESMRALSLLTQASGRQGAYYEGWAYPPGMLYLYWPLATLYGALGGTFGVVFPAQPAFIAPAVPLALQLAVRLPVLAADLASLWLLRALGVRFRGLWLYAFNPLVLLVGVWTFDSVAVLCLLLGVWLAERQRWLLAGSVLGLGAAVKFLPALGLPVLVIAVLRQPLPAGTRACLALATTGAAALTFGLLVSPVWDGLVYVVQFHASRFGGGLSWGQLWATWAQADTARGMDWAPPWQLYASQWLGSLLLPLSLLLGTLALGVRALPLPAGMLVMLLAFFAGSKLVNEPYALSAVALATVHRSRLDGARSFAGVYALLWVLPFAYAMLNTPAWSFLLSGYQILAPGSAPGIGIWTDAYRQVRALPTAAIPFALLATAFVFTTVGAILTLLFARPSAHPHQALA